MKLSLRWLAMMAFSLLAGTAGGSASAADEPVVLIETSLGNIKVKLYPDKTPLTVKNFLGYVDEKFYDNTIFHRVIGKENSRNDFMIQGGGIDVKTKAEKPTKAPVKNEADLGLPNRRGTIAMARTNVVDSATSQFFINVADNDFLNHTQKTREGYGYCAFGEVIEGMDVVDKIKAVKTTGDTGRNVPLEDVVIKSIRRVPAK